jgi:hypothetical protein
MEQVQWSEYIDWLLDERSGIWIPAEAIDVIMPKTVFGRGVAAGHSTLSSVEVKNQWSYTTGPTYIFMAWTGANLRFQPFDLDVHPQAKVL